VEANSIVLQDTASSLKPVKLRAIAICVRNKAAMLQYNELTGLLSVSCFLPLLHDRAVFFT
jgi:hypothetical protein